MNTPTHTSGPWKAQRAEGWRNTDIFACDKDETYICAINEDNDEREANARLIAAAPELLEALKAMVERWEPDAIGTDRRMWENARAAIAKAVDQ